MACVTLGLVSSESTYFFTRTSSQFRESARLHTHKGVEIYFLLKGEVEYIVENNSYILSPGEIIIARENERHAVKVQSPDSERIIIGLSNDFFIHNRCTHYQEMFQNRPLATGNRIKSSLVQEFGLLEAAYRIEYYQKDTRNDLDTVVKCAIIEFLHLLYRSFAKTFALSPMPALLAGALSFIDEHLSERISLEQISQHCYISKTHLCRLFKQHMAMTVNEYITRKRIERVKLLVDEGMLISEACFRAGFGDYSSFYRAYKKQMHQPPHKGLYFSYTDMKF